MASDKSFHLEVVTPEEAVFKGEVVSVTAPGEEGSFQVLHSHAPLLAALSRGHLKILLPDGTKTFFHIGGGFFEVSHNNAILLAESIDPEQEPASMATP
ncbi:MAG: F0F1 ATP synthase subunit epsilon [Rhizobacter sp.]|nr:F0F1 ATP synthase subunit epsilon [Chlorobiales bacterium]